MAQQLAYFLTWTCYGTWLPSDKRGWVHHSDGAWHVEFREESKILKDASKHSTTNAHVSLDAHMRQIVKNAILASCSLRKWAVQAINVRSNHVHIVLIAPDVPPERVMIYLKTWSSRWLNQKFPHRKRRKWWTRHGSTRYINSESSLAKAVEYVRDRQ